MYGSKVNFGNTAKNKRNMKMMKTNHQRLGKQDHLSSDFNENNPGL